VCAELGIDYGDVINDLEDENAHGVSKFVDAVQASLKEVLAHDA